LNNTALLLLRRLGIEPVSEAELAHSEEELRLLLAHAPGGAGGSKFGRSIVLNAFDLSQRIAREVMRPRHEMVGLDTTASLEECVETARKSRFSRFPLCEGGDLDHTLGVIHIKDLYASQPGARCGRDLLPAAHKILYIPETTRLEKLLQFFLERRLHLAIVVDEYGGTVGMVTLENVLEELVGQIQDEFDQEKPLITPAGEGLWLVDGALPLHELGELTGESIFSEGISTTSGWVTERLGGFAKVGDVVPLGRHELRVQEMDGLRVSTLKVSRLVPQGVGCD
jgi:CBS domain containing-hemolysin-like protein